MAELAALVSSQIARALGVCYMLVRRPDGSYVMADDEQHVRAAVGAGGEMFKIYTRPPDTAAFVALFDGTFGKPAQRVEIAGPEGQPIQVIKPW